MQSKSLSKGQGLRIHPNNYNSNDQEGYTNQGKQSTDNYFLPVEGIQTKTEKKYSKSEKLNY